MELINEIKELIVPPDFTFTIQEPMPVFYTDKLRLQQVFMNLISNAVKYQRQENKRIEIACKEVDGDYHFSITDNGIGIPKKYHDKIFVMFQTLREKDQTESTGVGLAIVKKIIEEKKGSIKVHSDIGKGASFVFTWPKKNLEFA
jgi:signal transduction histidine kinase